jgi:hypothetical protein
MGGHVMIIFTFAFHINSSSPLKAKAGGAVNRPKRGKTTSQILFVGASSGA